MRRVLRSLVSNGSASLISMALSVVIAREGGTVALGQFGVAYSAYLIAQLCAREAGISPLLAELPRRSIIRLQAGRSSLIGLISAVPVSLIGLMMGSAELVLVGACLNGMMLLNYSRVLSLTLDRGTSALVLDISLVGIVTLFSIGVLLKEWPVIFLVASWCVGSALLGYGAALWHGYHIRPDWRGRAIESRASVIFGGQSLLGAGSVHVLIFLLTAVGGASLVGALRGATTVVGPANLITTTVHPLLIRELARKAPTPREVSLRHAMKLSTMVLATYGGVVVILVAVGFQWGDFILGSAWDASEGLLLLVALDGLVAALAAVPIAAHRTALAAGKAARVTLFVLVVRVPLVLAGAAWAGAYGAAWGFLLATCFSTVTWWCSLVAISGRRST